MMFMPLIQLLLLSVATLPLTVTAQQSSTSALDAFPTCSQGCIVTAFSAGLCLPTNQTCICTDEVFNANVTACVTASCTIPDLLLTQNATLTNCGAEVRDRSQEIIVVSDTMAVVAALFVIFRFAYKILMMKAMPVLDDWLILAALVSAAPSAFITAYGTTANGLGKDIWTLTADQITNVLKYFYIMAALYFLQTALVKLSLIAFYLRIFPSRSTQRVLWGTFGFVSLWGTAFIFAAIFQCRPINYFWDQWDGLHEGSCVNGNAIAWSNAAMNIALDLWILAIPLWHLRTLQMHWKKKIGVAFMFSVGAFVTVMSILRLRSLVELSFVGNRTWGLFEVSLWSTIEICVGIMCACLPTIRLLLVKVFPILAGTTQRLTKSYTNRYGEGVSGHSQLRGNSAHVITVDRPDSVPLGQGRSGIVFHKTYNIQYSDNDETSLVNMDEFGKADERH